MLLNAPLGAVLLALKATQVPAGLEKQLRKALTRLILSESWGGGLAWGEHRVTSVCSPQGSFQLATVTVTLSRCSDQLLPPTLARTKTGGWVPLQTWAPTGARPSCYFLRAPHVPHLQLYLHNTASLTPERRDGGTGEGCVCVRLRACT